MGLQIFDHKQLTTNCCQMMNVLMGFHFFAGKFCMDLIDTDRASLAQEQGYQVALTRLHPTTCTTKNNLLIGLPGKKTTSDASGQGSKS